MSHTSRLERLPHLIRSESSPYAPNPRPRSPLERLVALSKSLPHLTSASPTQREGGKGEAPAAREGDGLHLIPRSSTRGFQALPLRTPPFHPLCSLGPSRILIPTVLEVSWLPRGLSETLDAMSRSQHLGHLCQDPIKLQCYETTKTSAKCPE